MCHFNVTILNPLPFASYFSVFLNASPMPNFYSSCFFYLPISVFSFTLLPNLSFYYAYFRFFCLLLLSVSLTLYSFYFDCKKLRSSIPQAELHIAWLAVSYRHPEQTAFRIGLLCYTNTEMCHVTSQRNNGRGE